jgi:ion channel-forming bestrophin family protein
VLDDLVAEQGKSERIKNFPFPRQYATVNFFFAVLFAFLIPFGLLPQFAERGPQLVWLTIPFSTIVSWVFLTTDKIGEWSENPFEGLANDVPITSMSRAIARDLLQLIGERDLPPPVAPHGSLVF